jgi:hypothetical protein
MSITLIREKVISESADPRQGNPKSKSTKPFTPSRTTGVMDIKSLRLK